MMLNYKLKQVNRINFTELTFSQSVYYQKWTKSTGQGDRERRKISQNVSPLDSVL